MAGSEYLADNVLDAVREEGLLPASDETSTNAKVRNILNREQRLYLASLLQRAREEYQLASYTISVVSGTTRYKLPPRASGAAITRVVKVLTTNEEVPLYPVAQERIQALGGSGYGTGDYYLDGNYLVLVADPGASETLKAYYPRRFNKVVAGTAACVISSIDTALKKVTLKLASDGSTTTLPTTFLTTATFDFIRGTPHFDVLGVDLVCTNVASNVLTMSATLPTELAVGDMMALAGESPVLTMPLELQDVLVLKAVHSYVSAMGKAEKTAAVAERLQRAEADLLSLISPRVKDSPSFYINFSGPGWNRGSSWRWRVS